MSESDEPDDRRLGLRLRRRRARAAEAGNAPAPPYDFDYAAGWTVTIPPAAVRDEEHQVVMLREASFVSGRLRAADDDALRAGDVGHVPRHVSDVTWSPYGSEPGGPDMSRGADRSAVDDVQAHELPSAHDGEARGPAAVATLRGAGPAALDARPIVGSPADRAHEKPADLEARRGSDLARVDDRAAVKPAPYQPDDNGPADISRPSFAGLAAPDDSAARSSSPFGAQEQGSDDARTAVTVTANARPAAVSSVYRPETSNPADLHESRGEALAELAAISEFQSPGRDKPQRIGAAGLTGRNAANSCVAYEGGAAEPSDDDATERAPGSRLAPPAASMARAVPDAPADDAHSIHHDAGYVAAAERGRGHENPSIDGRLSEITGGHRPNSERDSDAAPGATQRVEIATRNHNNSSTTGDEWMPVKLDQPRAGQTGHSTAFSLADLADKARDWTAENRSSMQLYDTLSDAKSSTIPAYSSVLALLAPFGDETSGDRSDLSRGRIVTEADSANDGGSSNERSAPDLPHPVEASRNCVVSDADIASVDGSRTGPDATEMTPPISDMLDRPRSAAQPPARQPPAAQTLATQTFTAQPRGAHPADQSPVSEAEAPDTEDSSRRVRPRTANAAAMAAATAAAGDAIPPAPNGPPSRASRRRDRPPRSRREGAAPAQEGGAGGRRSQRIDGGGTVMIDDRLFELVDWSSGGLSIRSDAQLYRVGDTRNLELEVDLGDYAVNLDLEGEVVNRTSDRTGWRFRSPSETQRQVFRALTHSSLHGRPFTAPRPLPGRTETVELRPASQTPTSRQKQTFSPLAAMMSLPFNAAIIGLIAGVAILTMKDQPTSSGPPTSAVADANGVRAERAAVAVERTALVATNPGLVLGWTTSVGEPARAGAPLVTLSSDSEGGGAKAIVSPCDCILAKILVEPGERVMVGREVAYLYPRGVEGHIQALFAADLAPKIGDRVSVTLVYSRDRYDGVVQRVGRLEDPQRFIGLPSVSLTGADTVFARIRTTPPLPAGLAGDPAIVTLEPETGQ